MTKKHNPALHEIQIHYSGQKWKFDDFVASEAVNNQYLSSIINFIKKWESGQEHFNQKTSGSTSKPKTISISRNQMIASANSTLKTLGLQPRDKVMLNINPEYIGGKMILVRALVGHLDLIIGELSGNPLKNYHEDFNIDFFSFVPYQLENIIDKSPEKISILNQSKSIILGGAPVSSSLTEKIKTQLTIPKVYSTFGMTETVSHVALMHINSSKEEPFKALVRIHFSVNSKNCLVIHAPEITGIKNLETNDVVELVSPTEFNWLGRYDYIINSGGIKIHPETVEKEIAKLFSQKNCMNRFFVFGLPDERLGEALHMAVEGEIESMDIEDLIKENLPPYHSPKKLFTVDQFIETESGKINRLKTIEDLKLKGFLR